MSKRQTTMTIQIDKYLTKINNEHWYVHLFLILLNSNFFSLKYSELPELTEKKRCRTKPFKGSENCNEFGTLFGFRTNKVSYQTIFYNREKGFRR
jgi:hypothetical protein